jgi:hypothetical protein
MREKAFRFREKGRLISDRFPIFPPYIGSFRLTLSAELHIIELMAIIAERMPAGKKRSGTDENGRPSPSGLCILRLWTDGYNGTRKILLQR